MLPLIDGDCLVYECAAVGEEESFNFVRNVYDERIATITGAIHSHFGEVGQPVVYLSGGRDLLGEQWKPNFRENVAVSKPYKGTRKVEKPYHYANLRHYINSLGNTVVSNGLEADDLIAIEATKLGPSAIIATRDKDLRQIPGWHYGWECGLQGELGPIHYSEAGELLLIEGKPPKLKGGGFAFFAAQLIMGDPVDNIPGLPKAGPVAAFNALMGAETPKEMLERVVILYKEKKPDDWQTYLREQANLLWLVRELNEDGSPVLFNPKDYLHDQT